jgi:uncharacterized protein (TIGR03083 family)
MINVNHLFPILHANLIELLTALKPDDWHKPTLCKGWSVKDVASHLLDGQLRRLSIGRDKYYSPRISPPEEGYENLLSYLNDLNASWVEASARISPKLLLGLHELIGPQYVEYITSLDPDAKATFNVAWAAEDESLNWMDVARDYTEQWLHQQHIREAVGKPHASLLTEELFKPVLDIWMLAMPYSYSKLKRPNGTAIEIVISGKVAAGTWHLVKLNDKWEFIEGWDLPTNARVKVDYRDAWKVLAKNLRGEEARAVLQIKGDEELAYQFADVAAVMA